MTALTHSSTKSNNTEDSVSPSDAAEYARYAEAQGLGDVVEANDDLSGILLADLGLEVGDDQYRR